VTTNAADEQAIVNNSIDAAGSLAPGLSARAELIRNFYLEGAATQNDLVQAYLSDLGRSFREQADKVLQCQCATVNCVRCTSEPVTPNGAL